MSNNLNPIFFEKSIVKLYNFTIDIIDNPNAKVKIPKIKDWHIINMVMQNYNFKKDSIKYGALPKSFAVMDFDGFELSIRMEEDDKGTISKLINRLQRKIIKTNGVYEYPNNSKLSSIIIMILNDDGTPIHKYEFLEPVFLRSTTPQMDYSVNNSRIFEISFGSDILNEEHFK